MSENDCVHQRLVLLTENPRRLRCRFCHLTIRAEELEGGCCPECQERSGRRHREFDEIVLPGGSTRYRCEDCGLLIPCQT